MIFFSNILSAFAILLSIPTYENNISLKNDSTNQVETIIEEETLVSDSDIIQYEVVDTTEVVELFDENNVEFELTEGMMQSMDSLLDDWYIKNSLYSPDCETSGFNPQYPDSVYIERMAHMQTVIEMPYNYIIRQYIDRYTGKNRNLVSYMLGASNFYMPIIEDALDYYELPQELKYMPIIESALNPVAVSRARAKGLWQFIYQTGKLYGLKQNSLVDERFDPIKSSYAAARYLKDLYVFFGDWNLAISAYNCGPGNVKKAILRSGGKTDFWEIYRYLPRETRGYLPTFVAANYVMTYYKEHNICPMQPNYSLTTDTVLVNRNLHFKQISALCNISEEEIKSLNPQYINGILPGNSQSCVLRLPSNAISAFINAGDSIYAYQENIYFPKSKASDIKRQMNSKGGDGVRHKIKSGETLSTIAHKYHVSVKQLMQWNGLKNSKIRAGKYLYIY